MKKWAAVLLVLMLVLGVSVSAMGEENIQLRFAYWGSGAEKEALEKALTSFEQGNPGITVERLHIPDDFATKLNAMIAAN